MSLVSIQEEYNKAKSEYIELINELSNSDLGNCDNEDILNNLIAGKTKFELIKIKSDNEVLSEEEKDKLKDIQYSIVDSLFLCMDLINFYKTNQVERFKMRAVNYVNKKRIEELF